MAKLTSSQRLQPSLLDRLTDDEPEKGVEGVESRYLSSAELRNSVIRDLSWLLNVEQLASCVDMDELTYARQSVINFGIPVMTGMKMSGSDVERLASQIDEAIRSFEPRLIKDTLSVRAVLDDVTASETSLIFAIEAEMWAEPLPLHLYLRAEVDLETGDFGVSESRQ